MPRIVKSGELGEKNRITQKIHSDRFQYVCQRIEILRDQSVRALEKASHHDFRARRASISKKPALVLKHQVREFKWKRRYEVLQQRIVSYSLERNALKNWLKQSNGTKAFPIELS